MPKGLSKEAKELVEKYQLNADENDPNSDIFSSNQFTIITRKGIDKITAVSGAVCDSLETVFIDPFEVVLKGTYSLGDRSITTTACASIDRTVDHITTREEGVLAKDKDGNPLLDGNGNYTVLKKMLTSVESIVVKKANVRMNPPYLIEMAEKRVNSRGILKLTGFYDAGVYGQDEAPEFDDFVKGERKTAGKKPIAKVKSEKLN